MQEVEEAEDVEETDDVEEARGSQKVGSARDLFPARYARKWRKQTPSPRLRRPKEDARESRKSGSPDRWPSTEMLRDIFRFTLYLFQVTVTR
jgi:hypothetical protein